MDRDKKVIIRFTRREYEQLNKFAEECDDISKGRKANVSAYIRKCIFEATAHPDRIQSELRDLNRHVRTARINTDSVSMKIEHLIEDGKISKSKEEQIEDYLQEMNLSLHSMEQSFQSFKEKVESGHGNHKNHKHKAG